MDISFMESVENLQKNGYDFRCIQTSPEVMEYIEELETIQISDLCVSINNEIKNLIEASETFENFEMSYNNFIQERLLFFRENSLIEEYYYAKLYSDVYLSSIDYISYYLCGESKGPRWDKFKSKLNEVWEEVKPIVAADAGGAVAGAITGAAAGAAVGAAAGGVGAGPGALMGAKTGAVVGGCAQSAGKIVENFVNNN